MSAENVCIGCGRTLDEIAEWPAADDSRRAEIRQRSQQRLSAHG